MLAYIIRRIWQMIPTMLGVVLLIFFLFNWVGGDPAYILAGKMSNPEQIENIRQQLGVDQPYYVQLWIFIKQILTFDYGLSWSTGESVSQIIMTRLGPSLTLLIPLPDSPTKATVVFTGILKLMPLTVSMYCFSSFLKLTRKFST
jgi:peptide/nickel transport system permease protein